MTLLSILDFGIGNLIALSAVFFVIAGIFGYQAYKAHNSGTVISTKTGNIYSDEKEPYWKISRTWLAVGTLFLYIGALIWIKSEYAPYNPSKHGVPTEQTDSTRQSAEDQIKK